MREIITLQCNDCKNRNYTTTKNRKKHSDRMETKKFCNSCRKHTGTGSEVRVRASEPLEPAPDRSVGE